ncbi:hypothetical protein Tco_0824353 [Tanacetum coccineum]|uniref:Uncharacterized protein n=1 Tax=Tanacetum coccineum TaxID=301880 RepID=A0ABQ5AMA4_9ASTR
MTLISASLNTHSYSEIKNEEIEIGPVDVEWNKAIGNRMKKQRSGYKRDDVVLLDVITAAIGFMITSFGLRWVTTALLHY